MPYRRGRFAKLAASFQIRQEPGGIGVFADQTPAAVEDRVDRTDGLGGGCQAVAKTASRFCLCGMVTFKPCSLPLRIRSSSAAKPAHGSSAGPTGYRRYSPAQPERLQRRLVQARRKAVRQGVAGQAQAVNMRQPHTTGSM